MKQTVKAMIVICVLMLSSSVWGGEKAGNGGMVHICNRGVDKGSISLLDFYRGKVEKHLDIVESEDDIDAQMTTALDRLKVQPAFYAVAQAGREALKKNFVRGKTGIPLVSSDDSDPVQPQPECHIEQLAIYDQQDQLTVQPELMDAVSTSNTQMAGFWTHEILAHIGKTNLKLAKTTDMQRLNALIFSSGDHSQEIQEILLRTMKNRIWIVYPPKHLSVRDNSRIRVKIGGGHPGWQIWKTMFRNENYDSHLNVDMVFGDSPSTDSASNDTNAKMKLVNTEWSSGSSVHGRAETFIPYAGMGLHGATIFANVDSRFWQGCDSGCIGSAYSSWVEIYEDNRLIGKWKYDKSQPHGYDLPIFVFD